MTKEQLSELKLNQRISRKSFNLYFEEKTKYGHVTKIYNGNYQVQVWMDEESKPRVVGYTEIELVDVTIK